MKEVRHVRRDSKHFRNNSEPLVRSQEAALGCMFDVKLITHIFHNSPYTHTHTHTHTHAHTLSKKKYWQRWE